jgi:hypothetical protein
MTTLYRIAATKNMENHWNENERWASCANVRRKSYNAIAYTIANTLQSSSYQRWYIPESVDNLIHRDWAIRIHASVAQNCLTYTVHFRCSYRTLASCVTFRVPRGSVTLCPFSNVLVGSFVDCRLRRGVRPAACARIGKPQFPRVTAQRDECLKGISRKSSSQKAAFTIETRYLGKVVWIIIYAITR